MRALSRQPSAVTDSWLFLSCTLRLLAAMPAKACRHGLHQSVAPGPSAEPSKHRTAPLGPRILKALLRRLVLHSLPHSYSKPEANHNTHMPRSLWNRTLPHRICGPKTGPQCGPKMGPSSKRFLNENHLTTILRAQNRPALRPQNKPADVPPKHLEPAASTCQKTARKSSLRARTMPSRKLSPSLSLYYAPGFYANCTPAKHTAVRTSSGTSS